MNIKASGLVEMIIAISIISICVGLFSTLFIRSTSSQLNFIEIKQQTEIQSQVYQSLINQSTDSLANKKDFKQEIQESKTENCKLYEWNSSRGISLWKQDLYTNFP